jgi:Caspase domain
MRRAFVMGSNGSKNFSPLQYALEDARRIKGCLESSRCGFEVTLIESDTDPFEIRRKLYNVAESCTPQDTFICYFAGHGIREKDSLLLFLDKTEISRLGTTSMPVSEVLQAFKFCQAHSKLLILDCCHAGAAVDAAGFRSLTEEPVNEIIHPDNHLVLMASDRFEKARELDTLKGGFLTANICAALGEKFHEADKSGNGRLSLQELMQWLKEKAIAHNTQYPDKQVPYPYTFGRERGDFFLTVDEPVSKIFIIPWSDKKFKWNQGGSPESRYTVEASNNILTIFAGSKTDHNTLNTHLSESPRMSFPTRCDRDFEASVKVKFRSTISAQRAIFGIGDSGRKSRLYIYSLEGSVKPRVESAITSPGLNSFTNPADYKSEFLYLKMKNISGSIDLLYSENNLNWKRSEGGALEFPMKMRLPKNCELYFEVLSTIDEQVSGEFYDFSMKYF